MKNYELKAKEHSVNFNCSLFILG